LTSINVPWITIPSGSSGSGNGTVTYNVAPIDSTTPRSGTLIIAGVTFTVNQEGAVFSLAPPSASVPAAGGAFSVIVNSTSPAAPGTAATNAVFLHITGGPSGIGNGTVSYSADANAGPTQRTGTLTIAGQIFTVTQDGATSGNHCDLNGDGVTNVGDVILLI